MMKSSLKLCAVALAITTALTGCNDDDNVTSPSNNNGVTYKKPIASDVTITGDSYVDSTLTGKYKFIDPNYTPRAEGNSLYEWRLDDEDSNLSNDVKIGVNQELPLTTAHLDQRVYFCVTPKADSNDSETNTGKTKCSTSTRVESGNGNKPVADNAVIDNTNPTVGDTLTGRYDYSDTENDPEGASTFRWTANDSDIAGADKKQLTLTNQQENKAIKFCVTPVSTNPENIANSPLVGDEVCTSATAAVLALAGNAPTATKPVITGDHTVGATLTAEYTYADADNDSEGASTFKWQRDGVDISGATAKTYTLQNADKGASITFVITPIATTGTPTQGSPVASDPITDVSSPVGDTPVITLNAVVKSNSDYPKVGDTLTGSYKYTATASGAADDSSVVWKADGKALTDLNCVAGSSCEITLAKAHLGKSLQYCVTPKATDSSSGAEQCSPVEKAYGITLSGTLEFGKTLNLAVYGYTNPTIEWKVDVDDTTGPVDDSNRTVRNTVTSGDTAKSFLIGDEVFKKIIDPSQDPKLDLDKSIGNKNGIIDDADWAQASLAGNVTMDGGSATSNTINAAHYIGKDVEVTITFTETGESPVTLIASQTPEVRGGVHYIKSDASKRGIEPVRELTFGTLVYHRPIAVAEAHLNSQAGFGKDVAYPRYLKKATGIEWAMYRAKKASSDTAEKYKSDFPAVDACLKLYDVKAGEESRWHLPASRYDGAYTANGYAAQGNKPPTTDADKPYALIKLADVINKNDNSVKPGLVGTYIDRKSPNAKLAYTVSPTTGRILNGDSGTTPYWSATTNGSNTNSVIFYEAGGSGNNNPENGRFVSCVRAK